MSILIHDVLKVVRTHRSAIMAIEKMRHKLKCVQRLSTFAMPMLRMSNGCMNKRMDA